MKKFLLKTLFAALIFALNASASYWYCGGRVQVGGFSRAGGSVSCHRCGAHFWEHRSHSCQPQKPAQTPAPAPQLTEAQIAAQKKAREEQLEARKNRLKVWQAQLDAAQKQAAAQRTAHQLTLAQFAAQRKAAADTRMKTRQAQIAAQKDAEQKRIAQRAARIAQRPPLRVQRGKK